MYSEANKIFLHLYLCTCVGHFPKISEQVRKYHIDTLWESRYFGWTRSKVNIECSIVVLCVCCLFGTLLIEVIGVHYKHAPINFVRSWCRLCAEVGACYRPLCHQGGAGSRALCEHTAWPGLSTSRPRGQFLWVSNDAMHSWQFLKFYLLRILYAERQWFGLLENMQRGLIMPMNSLKTFLMDFMMKIHR